MSLTVELSRLLRRYVSDYDENDGILLDYSEGKTVEHVIAELGIPRERVFTVLVNRRPTRIGHRLKDGDHVRLSMVLGAG